MMIHHLPLDDRKFCLPVNLRKSLVHIPNIILTSTGSYWFLGVSWGRGEGYLKNFGQGSVKLGH